MYSKQQQRIGGWFLGGACLLILVFAGLFSGLSIDDAKSGVAGKTFGSTSQSYIFYNGQCASTGSIQETIEINGDLTRCTVSYQDGSGYVHSNVDFSEQDDDILLTCSGGGGKYEAFVKEDGSRFILRKCLREGVFSDKSCSTPLYCIDAYQKN